MAQKRSKQKKHKSGEKVHIRYPYIVEACESGFVVYNAKMNDFDNWHTHIKGKKTCIRFIDNIFSGTVPQSKYLRESVLRVCDDDKFLDDVRRKIEKDSQKPKFVRVNRGAVSTYR